MISDIYIPISNPDNYITYPDQVRNDDMLSIIDNIINATKNSSQSEFNVSLGANGIFRCRVLPTVNGKTVVARRHNKVLPNLHELKLPFNITRWLTSDDLNNGGLIVIVGTPGSGKTTTCVASIKERLSLYGGVCLTIEDPPEYALQGRHGKGMCWQIPVTNNDEYHEAMKGALRGYPSGVQSILMMGEIRDPVSAASILNASIDGRLVFITMHAASTSAALGRLRAMATESLGINQSDYLIAESLKGVVHQRMVNGTVNADLLIATSIAKATIRTGKYENLGSEVDRQNTLSSLKKQIT